MHATAQNTVPAPGGEPRKDGGGDSRRQGFPHRLPKRFRDVPRPPRSALFDYKAAVFFPSGKAAVTYRVEAGVCLAGADPLGDREARGPAIDAWPEVAGRYAWAPAVMGAGEEGAKAYAGAGMVRRR
ncbi:hypothetical protein GCM10012280_37820 [Wenjunlia tyrosinilytica]|uniref:Phosphatidylglycerol lysyltransferase C-terminal domain-containing protein n=1 Tax=Wenjunlia tyrosinilytica TaxID=1544741 RepID=A0A918DZV4_9ACTN|nr:hypothetical protein GCM10012280_37820 [Wenjunlia tyrosinilytica]